MTAMELYGDILPLARPIHDGDLFSRRHPRMTTLNRAKLFAPFAALTGFGQCVRGQEVAYEPKRELSPGEQQKINRALCDLAGRRGATVSIEYYTPCTDPCHAAFGRLGLYRRLKGTAREVDAVHQILRVEDTFIPFDDIYRLRAAQGR